MTGLRALTADYCRQHGLDVTLSTSMPAGYETAFGTYVPETRTLHLNPDLPAAPRQDALFTLYHELRHAEQYQHPERFSEAIRRSLPYVVLYDGACFKRQGDGWLSCRLHGDEAWFTRVYMSLPYELDANDWACRQLADAGFPAAAEEFRRFWIPAQPLPLDELDSLFRRIDEALQA